MLANLMSVVKQFGKIILFKNFAARIYQLTRRKAFDELIFIDFQDLFCIMLFYRG